MPKAKRSMSLAAQEDALKDELSALDGTPFDGRKAVVCFPEMTPSRYLCGMPYLTTLFRERAYEMGVNTAHALIERYPDVLTGATVLLTG